MISCGDPGPSVPALSAQATSALVSAASPGAVTPSSLVTRILTCASPYRPGRRRGRQGPSRGVRTPVTGPSPPPGSAPHPRPGPGLLQFTRHGRPHAQDLRRLAHRAAVAHRARPPGGHRLRGGRHAACLLGGRHPGHRRLRRRRVVPFGPGPGARAVAQPAGRRPLRVQRGAGPGRPRRARAPQRHPRPRALAALDAPDPAPEPALPPAAAPPVAGLPVLPSAGARVPRRAGRG